MRYISFRIRVGAMKLHCCSYISYGACFDAVRPMNEKFNRGLQYLIRIQNPSHRWYWSMCCILHLCTGIGLLTKSNSNKSFLRITTNWNEISINLNTKTFLGLSFTILRCRMLMLDLIARDRCQSKIHYLKWVLQLNLLEDSNSSITVETFQMHF